MLEAYINRSDLSSDEITKNGQFLLYRSLNTRRLVGFFGSGISAAYGLPSWRDMVTELASAAIREANKIKADLDHQQKQLMVVLEDQREAIKSEPTSDPELYTAVLQLSENLLKKIGKQAVFNETVKQLVQDDTSYAQNSLRRRIACLSVLRGKEEKESNNYPNARQFYSVALLDDLRRLFEEAPGPEKEFFSVIFEAAKNLTEDAPEVLPHDRGLDEQEGWRRRVLPADRRSFFAVVTAAAHCAPDVQSREKVKFALERAIERAEAASHDDVNSVCQNGDLTDARHIRTSIDPLDTLITEFGIRRCLTTNYDLELERYLESLDYPFGSFVPGSATNSSKGEASTKSTKKERSRRGRLARSMSFVPDRPDELIEFAAGTSEIHMDVLHLHGRATGSDTMVITEEDYQEYYFRETNRRQLVADSLSLIFGSNPILFAGIGLKEGDFLSPLRRFVSSRGDVRDRPIFALMEAAVDPQARRNQILTYYIRYGVYVFHFGLPQDGGGIGESWSELRSLGREKQRLEKLKKVFDKPEIRRDDGGVIEVRASRASSFWNELLKEFLDCKNVPKALTKEDSKKEVFNQWLSELDTYPADSDERDPFFETFFYWSAFIRLDKEALRYLLLKTLKYYNPTGLEEDNVSQPLFVNATVSECEMDKQCEEACRSASDFLERLSEKIISIALLEKVKSLGASSRTWWADWQKEPKGRMPNLLNVHGNTTAPRAYVRHIHNSALLEREGVANPVREEEKHAAQLETLLVCFRSGDFSKKEEEKDAPDASQQAREFRNDLKLALKRSEALKVPMLMTVYAKAGVGSGRLVNEFVNEGRFWKEQLEADIGDSLFINTAFSEEFNSVFDLIIQFLGKLVSDNPEPTLDEIMPRARYKLFGERLDKLAESTFEQRSKVESLTSLFKKDEQQNPKRHLIIFSHFDLLVNRRGLPFSGVLEEFFWIYNQCAYKWKKGKGVRLPLDLVFIGAKDKLREFETNILHRFYRRMLTDDQTVGMESSVGPMPEVDAKLTRFQTELSPLEYVDKQRFKTLIEELFRTEDAFNIGFQLPEKFASDRLDKSIESEKAFFNSNDENGLAESIFRAWENSNRSFYGLVLLVTCVRETFLEPKSRVNYIKFESLETWLAKVSHALSASRPSIGTHIVIDHVLSRYMSRGDNVNHSQWRIFESFFLLIVRHIAAVHLPVNCQVLAHAPDIRAFLKENRERLTALAESELMSLDGDFSVFSAEGCATGANLEFEEFVYRMLAAAFKTLERRCILLPVHPRRLLDGKGKRYCLHRHMFEYIERGHGTRVVRHSEVNFYDLNSYLAAPKDMITLDEHRYTFLNKLVQGLIDQARRLLDDRADNPSRVTETSSDVISACLRSAMGIVRTNFSLPILSRMHDLDKRHYGPHGVIFDHQHRIRQILEAAKDADGQNLYPLYDEEIAWLYHERTLLAYAQGNYFDAQPLAKQTNKIICRYAPGSRGSASRIMHSLNYYMILIERGRVGDAEIGLEALGIERKLNDGLAEYLRLGLLGRVFHLQGRFECANSNYKKSILGLEQLNRARAISYFSRLQAQLYTVTDRFPEAKASAQKSAASAERTRQIDLLHHCRVLEAVMYYSDDLQHDNLSPTMSIAKLDAAIAYAQRLGLFELQCRALFGKAQIVMTLGDTKAAGELVRDGLILALRHNMALLEAKGLVILGHVSLLRRDTEIGLNLVSQGQRKAERCKYQVLVERAQQLVTTAESGTLERLGGASGFKLSVHSYTGF